MHSKKIAVCAMLTALGLAFAYAESLFVLPMPIPGIKLGLANIVVLLALYMAGERWAILISTLRVLLSTLLFAGASAFMFSAAGAVLSFLTMSALKRSGWFSLSGVSVGGAMAHNAGQLLAAAAVMGTWQVFWYLPLLTVAAALSGSLTGLCASLLLDRLKKAGRAGF